MSFGAPGPRTIATRYPSIPPSTLPANRIRTCAPMRGSPEYTAHRDGSEKYPPRHVRKYSQTGQAPLPSFFTPWFNVCYQNAIGIPNLEKSISQEKYGIRQNEAKFIPTIMWLKTRFLHECSISYMQIPKCNF